MANTVSTMLVVFAVMAMVGLTSFRMFIVEHQIVVALFDQNGGSNAGRHRGVIVASVLLLGWTKWNLVTVAASSMPTRARLNLVQTASVHPPLVRMAMP